MTMRSKWVKVGIYYDWVANATITETVSDEIRVNEKGTPRSVRRFTATVNGWRGFFICEGTCDTISPKEVQKEVESIRERIDSGDQSVFNDPKYIKPKAVK
jgi:hypothetical protein